MIRGHAAALIAGALLALAFPAPSWWWLAWVGLVPLLFVVRAAPTAAAGRRRAWVGMAGFVLATQYWLWPSAGPLLAVFAAAARRAVAAVGLGGASAARRGPHPRTLLTAVVVLPSAWVIAEAVRSWDRLGGPWALLGASQWNQPATLAPASLGGVWLVSFLVVAVNTAVVGAILLRSGASGRAARSPSRSSARRGSGGDPRPPGGDRADRARPARRHRGGDGPSGRREALTETLAGQRLDLVVWGESSVGVDLAERSGSPPPGPTCPAGWAPTFSSTSMRGRPTGGIYKSSVLIGPDGVLGSYAKTRLVPFGEYVPLRPLLGWATRHTKAAAEDRRRGDGPVVLRTDSLAVGPLISFETTFSDLPRRLSSRRRTAGVPELDIDVSRQLGTTSVGEHGRGARCRGRPSGRACRIVRCQFGVRCARRRTRMVSRSRTRRVGR